MMDRVHTIDSDEVLERFHSHLGLVDILARQVFTSIGGKMELDDLLSAGREGLLDAARRYDPTQGIPFRAYANFRVRGAILDGVRRLSFLSRRTYQRIAALESASLVSEGQLGQALAEPAGHLDPEQAEDALDRHLQTMVVAAAIKMVSEAARLDAEAARPADPERAYEQAELLELARAEVARLSPEESEIVRRHYFEGHGLEDIGSDLGMSKSWASRLHTRALSRLSKRMREHVAFIGCEQ